MHKYSHNIVLFPPGICINKEWAGTAGNNCKKYPENRLIASTYRNFLIVFVYSEYYTL